MEVKDKKQHILETAEELFSVKGFEAATVRDIADAAGVNLAMISYYFGSKEKLMEDLFHRRMDNMKLRVDMLVQDKSLTPFQKMDVVIDEYIKKVVDRQSFYKIMLCEQAMKKNPVIIKLLRELKLGYAAKFSELIKEGQKKKVFKKNIDVVLVLATMTGTVTQLMIGKDYYFEFNKHEKLTEAAQNELLFSKLSAHLKPVLKSILSNES